MSDVEITEGSNAVENKLAEHGADQVRRYSFSEAPEAAPDQGTPAEEVQADQPRNELGQFTSNEEPDDTAEAPAEAIQGEQSGQDPAVQALLNKYGGDVDKALSAAVHAQRRLGELGNELGQTRQENAEYEAMIQELRGLREDFAQQRQNTPLDQGTIDWFDQQAYENPYQMAEYARQQGNNVLFQRALGVMKETSPGDYAVYVNHLNNQQHMAQVDQKLQAATQIPTDSAIHMALANVRAKHPEYVNYDDAIEATLQRHPFAAKAMERAVASGDREQIEGSLETLYSLAVGDTLSTLALTGDAPDNTTSSADVVTPTTSETREPAPEPSGTDRFKDAFRQEAERRRRGVWVAE